ncbi:DNA helicase [Tanacetum coccineum]
MWNEMATEFNIREYETMEKPVVILVTSCYVTRYNGLKLSGGTSATHYYLNPNVAETYQIKQIYVPKAHSTQCCQTCHHHWKSKTSEIKTLKGKGPGIASLCPFFLK